MFPETKMKTGIRLVRLGNRSFEPKIQFLLIYQNGASGSDDSDPDSNFFNETNFKNFDTQYFFEDEVGNVLKDVTQHKFFQSCTSAFEV